MNTPNNKRRRESQEKIIKIFINLIQTKEINEITVSEICKLAKINRSTFYANYIDIYDLADKVKDVIIEDMYTAYKEERVQSIHSYDFLKLFKHIKDNQLFYKTYFKLNLNLDPREVNNNVDNDSLAFYSDSKYLDYHIEFFKAGLNAIIKKWLNNNCKESPEEINEILKSEYKNKS